LFVSISAIVVIGALTAREANRACARRHDIRAVKAGAFTQPRRMCPPGFAIVRENPDIFKPSNKSGMSGLDCLSGGKRETRNPEPGLPCEQCVKLELEKKSR
jgi:hypothetical protein